MLGFECGRREFPEPMDNSRLDDRGPSARDPPLAKSKHGFHDPLQGAGYAIVAIAVDEFALVLVGKNCQRGTKHRLHLRDGTAHAHVACGRRHAFDLHAGLAYHLRHFLYVAT